MDRRWDDYIHLGISYPKLFPHANSGEDPICGTMSTLVHDPFFTAIDVTWIKGVAASLHLNYYKCLLK